MNFDMPIPPSSKDVNYLKLGCFSVTVHDQSIKNICQLINEKKYLLGLESVDKLLLKYPYFSLALALKGLILIRLNNKRATGWIFDAIYRNPSFDPKAMQIVTYCHVETGLLFRVSPYLENSIRGNPAEEVFICKFMYHVYNQEIDKQYATAISLFRMSKDERYFGWALVSQILKVIYYPDEVTLPLAEKMLDRFLTSSEDKIPVPVSLFKLYFDLLDRQKKWKEMGESMIKYRCSDGPWSFDDFHALFVKSLKRLGMTKMLFEYLELTYNEQGHRPGVHSLLKEIVDLTSVDLPDKVRDFFLKIRISSPRCYEVILGDLYYIKKCMRWDLPLGNRRFIQNLRIVSKFGKGNVNFVKDISGYIPMLNTTEERQELLIWLSSRDAEGHFYGGVLEQIARDVNFETVDRLIYPDILAIQKIKRAQRCLKMYLNFESLLQRSKEEMIACKEDHRDFLLVIGATSLMYGYDNLEDLLMFTNSVAEVRQANPSWVLDDDFYEAILLTTREKQYSVYDAEYPLLTAIVLLEYGLEKNPYYNLFRILLTKAYSLLGVCHRPFMLMTDKNVFSVSSRWETMGYMILWKVLFSGMYRDAEQIFYTAEKGYIKYGRESMEPLMAGYFGCQFDKVTHCADERDSILNSVQVQLISLEKKILEFTNTVYSQDAAKQLALVMNAEGVQESLEYCSADHRNMEVWTIMESSDNLDLTKESSYEVHVLHAETRQTLLSLVTDVLLIPARYDDVILAKQTTRNISSWINQLAVCAQGYAELEGKTYGESSGRPIPHFHGVWPSCFLRYHSLQCFSMISEEAQCLVDIMEEPKEFIPFVTTRLNSIVLKHCREMIQQLKLTQASILNYGGILECLHCILEALSLSKFIVGVVLEIAKRKYAQTETKECKEANGQEIQDINYSESLLTLEEAGQDLLEYMLWLKRTIAKVAPYKWHRVQKSWNGLLGPELRTIVFPTMFDKVQHYISFSHQFQLKEMLKMLQQFLDYIVLLKGEYIHVGEP